MCKNDISVLQAGIEPSHVNPEDPERMEQITECLPHRKPNGFAASKRVTP